MAKIFQQHFSGLPHGPARLQQFLHHLNSIRPTIKLTMEVESNDALPLLNILVMKRGLKLAMKVYRKPTLRLKFNHPHHVKSGVVHNLTSRAKVICQEQKDFNIEIKKITRYLMHNEYRQEFVDSMTKPLRSRRPSSDTIYQDTVIIPYDRVTSDNWKPFQSQDRLQN
jgi:hypothetical protein